MLVAGRQRLFSVDATTGKPDLAFGNSGAAALNVEANKFLNTFSDSSTPTDGLATTHKVYLAALDYARYLPSHGTPTNTDISNLLTQPDPNGKAAPFTDEQLIAKLLSTSEYYLNAGNTNALWVQKAYLDLLGSFPNDATSIVRAIHSGCNSYLQY